MIKGRRKKKSRSRAKRRSRGNPTVPVIFANPGKRRRKRRHRARTTAAKVVRRQRKRRHAVKSNPTRHRRRRHLIASNPRRRRRHRRNPSRRAKLHRRRRNPMRLRLPSIGGAIGILRLGVAGGLGIVVSRMGGNLYRQHVSNTVRGIVGGGTVGGVLDDMLRLAAMGAATHLGHIVLQKVKIAKPAEVAAFKVGGYAEMGRQAIGQVLLKRLAPSVPLSSYGLDGYNFGTGLEDASSFEGLGNGDPDLFIEDGLSMGTGIEDASAFEGII